MKTDISPMFLTYHMVKWNGVKQHDSDQKCQFCGAPLKETEELIDKAGGRYEGYVCHNDKWVTWVRKKPD